MGQDSAATGAEGVSKTIPDTYTFTLVTAMPVMFWTASFTERWMFWATSGIRTPERRLTWMSMVATSSFRLMMMGRELYFFQNQLLTTLE